MATHHLHTGLDVALIRRLTVLKVWVDACGVAATGSTWRPAHSGAPFDPASWLRQRDPREYDDEDIGLLAVPAPEFSVLSRHVRDAYGFLADLDADEKIIARAREADRSLVLRLLQELPGGRLRAVRLR